MPRAGGSRSASGRSWRRSSLVPVDRAAAASAPRREPAVAARGGGARAAAVRAALAARVGAHGRLRRSPASTRTRCSRGCRRSCTTSPARRPPRPARCSRSTRRWACPPGLDRARSSPRGTAACDCSSASRSGRSSPGYLGLLLAPDHRDVALGGARGPRPALLPALARAHQPAQPHPLGRGRALGVRAVGGLPHRRRSVRSSVGAAAPADRRMDVAARLPARGSTVPAAIAGAIVARPRYFEDERAA